MKRIITLILVFYLTSLMLSAQNRISYSLDFVAGVGVEKGPLVSFAPEFVAQYNLGGFVMGVGAGARYARPCYEYDTRHSRSFKNELDIPVFIRLGYGKAKLFANVDAGYAIGILGYDTENRDLLINRSTSKRVYPYDGLFFEPHFGWRFGQRSALALGVLLQQSTILNLYERKDVIAGKEETVFYGKDTNSFSPAITLRYVVGF